MMLQAYHSSWLVNPCSLPHPSQKPLMWPWGSSRHKALLTAQLPQASISPCTPHPEIQQDGSANQLQPHGLVGLGLYKKNQKQLARSIPPSPGTCVWQREGWQSPFQHTVYRWCQMKLPDEQWPLQLLMQPAWPSPLPLGKENITESAASTERNTSHQEPDGPQPSRAERHGWAVVPEATPLPGLKPGLLQQAARAQTARSSICWWVNATRAGRSDAVHTVVFLPWACAQRHCCQTHARLAIPLWRASRCPSA